MGTSHVESHYSRGDLRSTLFRALEATGLDPDNLQAADLAPVDEFHIRGREATQELMGLAEFRPGDHVLDVGCGIGGPARHLAEDCGCRVTGLEVTQEYCDLASDLTAKTGLDHRVGFQPGDAQAMPFGDQAFDGVWTLHMTMNVPDKDRLYAEMRRILRPGGRLAMYEIVAGAGGDPHLPAPWARSPAINHLTTAGDLRAGLESQGFRQRHWRDVTEPAAGFFATMLDRARTEEPPPLGLHLVLGPDMGEMAANMLRNLEEERIQVVQLVMDG